MPDVKKTKCNFASFYSARGSVFAFKCQNCSLSDVTEMSALRFSAILVQNMFVNSDVKCVSGRGLIIRRLSVQKVFYFKNKKNK